MSVTKNVSTYIQEKGISVLRMCEKTGLSYKRIQPSLSRNCNRELRAEEFMTICRYIGVDPKEFAPFIREDSKGGNTNAGKSARRQDG